ncbi:MAG: class I SAM-dependent methyltransferase [Patescibacteria group bacterium]|nr:class I SAM-dependent methyltransferase [Patescibacteria group bacterium]
MESAEYENIYKNEATHFYYVGIHSIVISLIKKYSRKKNPKILDAGCGAGLLAKKMSALGRVYGIDLSKEAIKYAKKRNINVKIGSVTKIPYPNNYFDIVTCIDVINLAEVDNEQKALSEIFRVLKPNGILIMRASAIPWLASEHDKWVHIKKRYFISEVKEMLAQTKFKIEKLSYINFFLFLPALIKHILWQISGRNNSQTAVTKVNTLINKIMIALTRIEQFFLNYTNLFIGNGIIAVARKLKS